MTDRAHGRAAYQVLVLPYRHTAQGIRYALLRRADADYWQGISGGGEDDETPLTAARRESAEEAGLVGGHEVVLLDARATIPVVDVTGEFSWGPEVFVIPEYAFSIHVEESELRLSEEHTEYRWCTREEAAGLVRWDSNRTALWELDYRLRHSSAHAAI
ncbi:NUDIX hydrolase [Nocardia altamirensis]|uniref:NUDIX hydrolase n=1 Tax=Nocardia altamirensis TaxID=472158 RepID=UPI000AC2D707|nr:NUDIX pyrophosphatase [Nocardia altamirensis]